MWFNVLKNDQRMSAYNAFLNALGLGGDIETLNPSVLQNPEVRDDGMGGIHATIETARGRYYFIKSPAKSIYLESPAPYQDYEVFVFNLFREEYPEAWTHLRKLLSKAVSNKRLSDPQELDEELRTVNRKVHMALHRFITRTMREILVPAAGISAAYRTEITTDLTNALPKPISIFPMLSKYPDYSIENILRYYQDGFRNNLASKRTPYTMEHIINLVDNFAEKLLDAIDPSDGKLSQSEFVVKERDIMAGLNRTDIEDLIYSAIEKNPQDIELFVNNLP